MSHVTWRAHQTRARHFARERGIDYSPEALGDEGLATPLKNMAALRSDAPSLLYKLRGIDRFRRDLQDLLVKRTLWLSKPKDFCDPYEFRPELRAPPPFRRADDIESEIAAARGILPEDEVRRRLKLLCTSPRHRERLWEAVLEEDLSKFGVVSLSTTVESPILWDRYASGHRGFAVGYKARDDHDGEAIPAFPVHYQACRPVAYSFGPEPDWFEILTTKWEEWAYEKEWRYVRLPGDGGPGHMQVPAGAIVEVRIGLDTPSWHRQRIIAAARRLRDKPRILEARRSGSSFALAFDQVDE